MPRLGDSYKLATLRCAVSSTSITLSGTFDAAGTMMVNGPGQNRRGKD